MQDEVVSATWLPARPTFRKDFPLEDVYSASNFSQLRRTSSVIVASKGGVPAGSRSRAFSTNASAAVSASPPKEHSNLTGHPAQSASQNRPCSADNGTATPSRLEDGLLSNNADLITEEEEEDGEYHVVEHIPLWIITSKVRPQHYGRLKAAFCAALTVLSIRENAVAEPEGTNHGSSEGLDVFPMLQFSDFAHAKVAHHVRSSATEEEDASFAAMKTETVEMMEVGSSEEDSGPLTQSQRAASTMLVPPQIDKGEVTEGERNTSMFRIFAPKRRLMRFDMVPVLPLDWLLRLNTSQSWKGLFVISQVLLTAFVRWGGHIPGLSTTTYNWLGGGFLWLSGLLFLVLLSQYSRSQLWYCCTTFDFLYQMGNIVILLLGLSYNNVRLAPNWDPASGEEYTGVLVTWVGGVVFQMLTMTVALLTLDACYTTGRTFRAFIVCYFAVYVGSLYAVWRFTGNWNDAQLISLFGLTTINVPTVVEASTMTCFFYAAKYFLKFVIKNQTAVLTTFELQEALSSQEKASLVDRGEFSMIVLLDDATAHRRKLVLSLVSKTLNEFDATATIHVAESGRTSPAEGGEVPRKTKRRPPSAATGRRCYAPTTECWTLNAMPLWQSARLARLTRTEYWNSLVIVSQMCLLFALAPIPYADDAGHSSPAGTALLTLRGILEFTAGCIFTLHVSQYSSGVFRCAIQTFDFAFLLFESVLVLACNCYRTWSMTRAAASSTSIVTLGTMLFVWVTDIILVLGMDAGRFSRREKAGHFLVFLLIWVVEVVSWRWGTPADLADRVVTHLLCFSAPPLGSVAQAAAITVGIYCMRYVHSALVRKADTTLTFNSQEIPSVYALDEELARSALSSTRLLTTSSNRVSFEEVTD